MTKKAAIGNKRLISLDLQAWVQWILQNSQMQAQEILSSKFQWVSREGDVLIRVKDPAREEFLLANEIQLRYSPKMPRRMREKSFRCLCIRCWWYSACSRHRD